MRNEQAQRRDMKGRKEQWEAIWWAGAFLWAGFVLLLDSAEALPGVGGADAWSWVFAGAGLCALGLDLLALLAPEEPNPTTWDWTWTGILLILGFAGFASLEIAFPLILLLIGGVLSAGVVLRRDGRDKPLTV